MALECCLLRRPGPDLSGRRCIVHGQHLGVKVKLIGVLLQRRPHLVQVSLNSLPTVVAESLRITHFSHHSVVFGTIRIRILRGLVNGLQVVDQRDHSTILSMDQGLLRHLVSVHVVHELLWHCRTDCPKLWQTPPVPTWPSQSVVVL